MDTDNQQSATAGAAASPLAVVGLAAAADNLPALEAFLARTPPDSGMAFLVLVHPAPPPAAQLTARLAAQTAMPVSVIKAPLHPAANHVYLAPADQQLMINAEQISLAPFGQSPAEYAPIDTFLRALGTAYDGRAVGVLLAGTGNAGVVGLPAIKERGGLTLVQQPAGDESGLLPNAAIDNGAVDLVLPAEELPVAICEYWRKAQHIDLSPAEAAPAANETLLQPILTLLRDSTGHDFSPYKRPTLLRRIARRMQIVDIADLAAYVRLLNDQPAELQNLQRDLLIGVTSFFRDPAAFAALDDLLPPLFAGRTPGESIRAWVTACATGEEAYSLAMLLHEHAARHSRPPAIQIFATDVEAAAIAVARASRYPAAIAADVSPERLQRFFTAEPGGYRIKKEIRDTVLFAPHDLLRDAPFTRLDLVTCRNLLIYLAPAAQQRLLELFHFVLKPNGLLMLGTAETVDSQPDLFGIVDKTQHIYRRRNVARRVPLPISAEQSGSAHSDDPVHTAALRPEDKSLAALHQQLVVAYGDPSVLVDNEGQIVHLAGRLEPFLQFAGGVPAYNLQTFAHPDLRPALAGLLAEVAANGQPAILSRQPLRSEQTTRLVNLQAYPVTRPGAEGQLVWIRFTDLGPTAVTQQPEAVAAETPLLQRLEAELRRLREQLRLTVDQYENSTAELQAANEELQTRNEELRSAAEELETNREELQSVNEELAVINQEHRDTIAQISRSNNDLQNLMAATTIATVFVNREFAITRYTPAARAIFNCIPTDIGRPLSHISHTLLDYDPLPVVAQVLQTLAPHEREVRSTNGNWYLARFQPYRTVDGEIEGVVLTFVDITDRRQAEEALRTSETRQRFLLALGDRLLEITDSVTILTTAAEMLGRHLSVSRAGYTEIDAAEEYGTNRDWTAGDLASSAGKHRVSDWGPAIVASYRRGETWQVNDVAADPRPGVRDFEAVYTALNIRATVAVPLLRGGKWVALIFIHNIAPRNWTADEVALIREVGERTWDAVERARAETALRDSEARYRVLFTAIDEAFAICEIILDAAGSAVDYRLLEANPAFEQMTGITPAAAAGKTARELVPTVEQWWIDTYARVALQGEAIRFENRVAALDRWFDTFATPFAEPGSGKFVIVFRDISERKRFDAELAEAREYAESIVETIHEPLLVLTPDLRVKSANPAFYTQFTVDPAETVDRLIYELGNGQWDIPALRTLLDDVLPDNQVFNDYEVSHDFESIGLRVMLLNARRLDHVQLILLGIRDITERARSEAALRESEARFRAIADLVPDMLWSNDPQGVTHWNNRRWMEYTGQTFAEATDYGWLDAIHPDDRATSLHNFQQAIDAGEPLQQEHRIRAADGSYHWFLVRAEPVRDAAGRITQWFGAATDIQAQRDIQAGLEAARDTLEVQVAARTADLVASNQALQTEMQQRIVAEEARQELLRQLMAAQEAERLRIARDLHDQFGQQITGMLLGLKQVKEQAQDARLSALITPLQELATQMSKEVHHLALNLRPTSLDDAGLVPALERLVNDWSNHTGVAVEFFVHGFGDDRLPPPVEVALFRIVQEALTNVQKHAAASTVSVLIERRAGEVRVIVEDNGSGYDVNTKPTTAVPGLGLLGMHERVAQLGGSLQIESQPGSGTSVFVRVPV